ncbi:MAG: 3'-5' exonuclease [Pseudohongiellaceae bacterium]
MSNAEVEEKSRLEHCKTSIRDALDDIEARLGDYAGEIQTRKEYMWEARRDMDHIEKIAVRQAIEQTLDSAEALQEQQIKLTKLMRSPYFGRFDFSRDGEAGSEPVYIGVHHFRDEATQQTQVYDWRAPIASMFYDFETGPARYQAPAGEVAGELTLKRQFRIRDGRLEFVLESGVNIVDDVLQDELSRASDDEGMKNIVATIQRDQNAIIRNDEAHTLIIQGVAGSGKTSIALHRIAYLLYRFKDTLSADDILIISPNRVFADYIGNVLPELGEEQVAEIGMETLAEELLDHQYRFQTFFEQTSALLEKQDEALRTRIEAKASLEFLRRIDAYVEHLEAGSFVAAQWRTGRKIVPDWFFAETWEKHRGVGLTERVARAVKAAESQIGIYYNYDLRTDERQALREAIRGMVGKQKTLRQAYQGLFEWLGQPEMFRQAGGRLEYADVFPLIYLKMRLEKVKNPYQAVKHLLIDEMQDYTPVQYAVLDRLFSCPKTVLGDAAQSVNPYTSSSAEQIRRRLRSATSVTLSKSYRSTWEIMQLALAIVPNPELKAMERHGEAPRVVVCKRRPQMIKAMAEEIAEFNASDHHSLAIIAKTQKQASRLQQSLSDAGFETRLLSADSVGFSTGVLVCTAHLAKGLEFDRVIVGDVGASNYHTRMDRNQLYVACTRAMHRLTLYSVGEPSPLLPAQVA